MSRGSVARAQRAGHSWSLLNGSPLSYFAKGCRYSAERAVEYKRLGLRRLAIEQLEDRRLLTVDLVGTANWTELGSKPILSASATAAPGNPASGGIESVAVDPNNIARIFVGAVNGGIWRTTNGTRPFNGVDDDGANGIDDPLEQPSWTPLTDQFPSLAIGDLKFSPLDPTGNTLFAGTGSTSSLSNAGGQAIGVMRTTDGGATWSVFPLVAGGGAQPLVRSVLPTTFDGDAVAGGVQQVVLVGSVNGLHRSIDGGQNYTLIGAANGLLAGAVTTIIADPNNASQFFAGVVGRGVFRSTNGGLNWTPVNTNLVNLAGSTSVQLEAHPGGGTTVLHVLISGTDGGGTAAAAAFSSNNSGTTWTPLAALPAAFTSNNQGLYTTRASDQLTIDPTNSAVVYLAKGYAGLPMGVAGPAPLVLRYNPAGGGSWVTLDSVAAVGNTAPHVDSRDLQFVGNNVLVHANDGGVYFLPNPANPTLVTDRWTSFHGRGATGLGVTEYHNVAWDSTFNVAYGGAQDNGTSVQNGFLDPIWTQFRGSDGGDAQVDTLNAGAGQVFRYSGTQFSNATPQFSPIQRHTFNSATGLVGGSTVTVFPNAGLANFNPYFVPLYELNTVNFTRLVTGGSGTSPVYELTNASTTNGANANWVAVPVGAGFGAVNANNDAPMVVGGRMGGVDNIEVLIVGSGSGVFVRSTAGGTLTATPTAFPGGTVQAITSDPENWQHFFVTDGTNVFETPDAGMTWNNLTRNMAAINSRLQSLDFIPSAGGGTLMAGGNLGVSKLALSPATNQWSRFGLGLPNALVEDLEYNALDDVLLASTYGRGAFLVTAASVVAEELGVLNICGDELFTNQDDTFRLVRNAMNPLILDVFLNSVAPVFSVAIAALTQINVFGIGGNDTLIVDSTNGLINVPNGIRYDGDGACPDPDHEHFGYDRGLDTLQLVQTGGVTHTSSTVSVGATVGSGVSTIVGVGAGNTQTVFFEELEPVTDNVPAALFTLNALPGVASLLQAANAINYEVGLILGPTAGRLTADAFEPVEFTNKTAVVVDAGAGRDDVHLNNSLQPTGLATLTINGGDGDDTITAAALSATITTVTLNGGSGNDRLDATTLAQVVALALNGGAGQDHIVGGMGLDAYAGGADDDILVASPGNDTVDGDGGVDEFQIIGRQLPDMITANQTAATTLVVTYNGATRTYTTPEIEGVLIDGRLGDDIVAINVVEAVAAIASLPFEVIGNAPNASDRLVVNDDGLGDLVLHREAPDSRSGSITIGQFAPVSYQSVERVDITPLNSVTGGTGSDGLGRLVVFEYDDTESNDSLATATPVGVTPVFLRQRNIDPGGVALPPPFPGIPGDNDWYKFRPGKIGTFRIESLFTEIGTLANGRPGLPGDGDLTLQVFRANGTLIATSASLDDNESLDISMAANTDYFIRVIGATADAINAYDLNVKEVDILGPQIFDPDAGGPLAAIFPGNANTLNLFDLKPHANGPTPLVTSLTINLRDLLDVGLEVRAPGDVYPALLLAAATSPEHYQVRGDHVGLIPIQRVNVVNNPVAAGQIATATVQLVFAQPLPDDRFTLTILDSLVDPPRNAFDGGTNAAEPTENPAFPSGNGISGGRFLGRFTIDSRPEIGVSIAQGIQIDINGNYVWDPANAQIGGDQTNVDLAFELPGFLNGNLIQGGLSPHDLIAVGKFTAQGTNVTPSTLFDQLASYGNFNGVFQWLIDFDSDGVVYGNLDPDGTNDFIGTQVAIPGFNSTAVAGAIPIAGNFDNNLRNGDEIGLYYAGTWALDIDHNNVINAADRVVSSNLLGTPVVGDFDGNGFDDLAVFNNNVFSFDLTFNALADATASITNTLTWGFPGVLDRPVAADMNRDGVDDLGLWAPRDGPNPPRIIGEWYWLVSSTRLAAITSVPAANQFVATSLIGAANPPIVVGDLVRIRSGNQTDVVRQVQAFNAATGLVTLNAAVAGLAVGDLASIGGAVNQISLLNHGFSPPPFGQDIFAEFGDELALPIVGNFDPPTTAGPALATRAGDADLDGDTDGHDFLTWQRQLGSAGAGTTADFDGNGLVGSGDLSIWRNGFGGAGSALLAVNSASSSAPLLATSQEMLELTVLWPMDIYLEGNSQSKSRSASLKQFESDQLLPVDLAITELTKEVRRASRAASRPVELQKLPLGEPERDETFRRLDEDVFFRAFAELE